MQALKPTNPLNVIEEALQQLRHPALIREEGSPVLVQAIMELMQERRGQFSQHSYAATISKRKVSRLIEPRMLEKSLARLSQPRLQFQMQAVTLPLLLQLGTSDIRLQRVVASLLTIQAARFPALIVPVLRRFIRKTLLRIDHEIAKRYGYEICVLSDRQLANRLSQPWLDLERRASAFSHRMHCDVSSMTGDMKPEVST